MFAQDYLYATPPPYLIVGSSLAARLTPKDLASHQIYNLSFGGGSALTGLNIIKYNTQHTNIVPRVIYIEENIVLIRDVDHQMLDALLNPMTYTLRRYIPALRERYQPINFVLSSARKLFKRDQSENIEPQRNERVYHMMLEGSEKSYQEELVAYENNLKLLRDLLAYFESLGTQIVFFQMPIDPKLANLKKPTQQREILLANFPQYKFLPDPSHSDYITNDGIHLRKESASRFTQEFLSKIDKE
ncbi:hypothetical protein [Helicobacter equorum]|uniref:hypothetical protein n=1 Tax=Helicobacter equorum TaxID=361872 RepID=UPI001315169D|nr:hypothetical protein [Helicobacter equorum]